MTIVGNFHGCGSKKTPLFAIAVSQVKEFFCAQKQASIPYTKKQCFQKPTVYNFLKTSSLQQHKETHPHKRERRYPQTNGKRYTERTGKEGEMGLFGVPPPPVMLVYILLATWHLDIIMYMCYNIYIRLRNDHSGYFAIAFVMPHKMRLESWHPMPPVFPNLPTLNEFAFAMMILGYAITIATAYRVLFAALAWAVKVLIRLVTELLVTYSPATLVKFQALTMWTVWVMWLILDKTSAFVQNKKDAVARQYLSRYEKLESAAKAADVELVRR